MPFSLRKQTIRSQDTALRALAELVRDGIESPHVRATALKIVRDCGSRDDQCELQKIFDAVKHGDSSVKALEQGFPYRADPKTIDWFSGADRLLKMCEAGACGGDCLPLDTQVLRRDFRLVPIGDISEGDVIMADGAWTRVTRYWDKGIQPLLAFDLSNGCTLRCTPDHKLFLADRTEIAARNVAPGMDLLTVFDGNDARVRAIRALAPAPTCDIETDAHCFYLPETDLLVHNCDEHTVMLASLAGSLGFTVGLRAYGKPEEHGFSHIYAVVITPKKAGLSDLKRSMQGFGGAQLSGLTFGESVETVGMDTTVPSSYLGWQPPRGHYKTAWITDE